LINTIWSIDRSNAPLTSSFEDIATTGTLHFQSLFKEENRASIDVVLQVSYLFPGFIDHEGNDQLMAEITKEELQATSSKLSKDKSLQA
jgi:hypothetical protein